MFSVRGAAPLSAFGENSRSWLILLIIAFLLPARCLSFADMSFFFFTFLLRYVRAIAHRIRWEKENRS